MIEGILSLQRKFKSGSKGFYAIRKFIVGIALP